MTGSPTARAPLLARPPPSQALPTSISRQSSSSSACWREYTMTTPPTRMAWRAGGGHSRERVRRWAVQPHTRAEHACMQPTCRRSACGTSGSMMRLLHAGTGQGVGRAGAAPTTCRPPPPSPHPHPPSPDPPCLPNVDLQQLGLVEPLAVCRNPAGATPRPQARSRACTSSRGSGGPRAAQAPCSPLPAPSPAPQARTTRHPVRFYGPAGRC